ncbi:MAG: hypothetical protein QM775_23315 [Pirellulales bacterium]
MPSFFRRVRFATTLVAICGCLVPPQLWADSYVWTGGGTATAPLGGNFSVDGNWLGGDAPPGLTLPDAPTFGGSGNSGYASINNLALTPPELSSLTFNSTAATAVILRGAQLSFSGTPQIVQSGTGQVLVENDLQLNNPLTLRGTAAGIVSLSGVISGSGTGITKSEASTYVLRGLNTYSGTTTIGAGTLIASGHVKSGESGALGNAPSSVALNGGALYLAGQAVMSRSIDVGGAATFGNNTIGNVVMTGDILYGSAVALTLNSVTGGSLQIDGALSGAGSVVIGSSTTFAGSVRMTAGNNYTGATTLTNGRLSIGAHSTYVGSSSCADDI